MSARGTPWLSSVTVSRSGHRVAAMRLRRSSSSLSEISTRNFRTLASTVAATSFASHRLGGSEEAGQQLVDSLRLVVMNPVRGIRQPLDTLEVRDVVVLGLGEFFA